jgi:CHASE2 domain-containing sensor protein
MKDFIKITMWLLLIILPVLIITIVLKYLRMEGESLRLAISLVFFSNFFVASYIMFTYGNQWTKKVYNSLKSIFNLKK